MLRWFLTSLIFVLLPSMVLAQGGQRTPASAAVLNGAGTNPAEMAKVFYAEANNLYYQGKFKEALAKFNEAYTFDQNATLKFNICKCKEKLKDPEAGSCFQEYIAQFPTDNGIGYAQNFLEEQTKKQPQPPTSAPASATPPPSALPETCVLLLREIPANAEVRVNGKMVDHKAPVITDCAQQRIEMLVAGQLSAGGRVMATKEKPAEWEYKSNTPVDPALLKDKTSSSWGRREWGWTSISVSAIAAAAAGYFTYSMYQDFATADKRNGNHAYTVGEFRSAVSDGKNNRTRAIVSGVVAVVTGGLGGYLVLTGDDESPTAAIAPSFGGFVLTGIF